MLTVCIAYTFYTFILNLFVFLYFRCYSSSKHTFSCCIFKINSNNLCFLIGIFTLLIVNISLNFSSHTTLASISHIIVNINCNHWHPSFICNLVGRAEVEKTFSNLSLSIMFLVMLFSFVLKNTTIFCMNY